jgi:thiol-disulfide isomerase/thioredoxin
MDAAFLGQKFAEALPYQDYLATGKPEEQKRWGDFAELVKLTPAQKTLVGGFVREVKVLIVSGIWCGDCVQQCPILQRIAEANPAKIKLRLVDRDAHKDLSSQLRICGGDRVPVVLFMAEDHELCAICGDRTLNRYRAMASRLLGAACPTGLIAPGQDELAQTIQDWINEFERVELMLRLSGRLRQKYGD